jgi:hypothetical protein
MRNSRRIKAITALLLCVLMAALPLALLAQDNVIPPESATDPVNDDGPQGVGILMLLLGMGGVTVVGGSMIARDRFKSDDDSDN